MDTHLNIRPWNVRSLLRPGVLDIFVMAWNEADKIRTSKSSQTIQNPSLISGKWIVIDGDGPDRTYIQDQKKTLELMPIHTFRHRILGAEDD